MATEEGKAAARAAATAAMSRLGMNQAALSRKTGVDPNTISTFLSGARWPTIATLGRLDQGLDLTPGTLAGLGEDAPAGAARPDLSALGDPELVAELTYRLEALRRELAAANRLIEQYVPAYELELSRRELRMDYLAGIGEDSPEAEQWISHEWVKLMFEASDEGSGWKPADQRHYWHLCSWLDALAFAAENELALVDQEPTQKSEPPAPKPDNDQGGQLVELRPNTPKVKAARNAPSRGKQLQAEADAAGEESQDPADHDHV